MQGQDLFGEGPDLPLFKGFLVLMGTSRQTDILSLSSEQLKVEII